ncbi:3-oxoacyl-[acyl-carrier-protein] reductase [Rickettsiales endosymbiont of Stachyamoeba lipophora]|uniref:3-oxoacyl-[acyl-carrier-protein] reductase n=1 Tax=Rickettsiales endosymbiont of Stachyamoeba lipophora TaxID=2486578 RepID=UPI000F64A159|nr:3-oxoacyl-[acyl-carrier-protein] reductase [Rickettsiales endosymbiont of Stachyamoeba lipophora]AZL15132.1 3-oxoacyl-[acyl-carrier-protein] reductase [Rickettsiales endosymbiont of Stachyamoeba lipophora]
MLFNFQNKKVLVTGGTGGIGAGIVEAFAKQGATVCISGSNERKLVEFSKQTSIDHFVVANLKEVKEASYLIEQAHSKLGGLDIVICNAGITKDTLALRMSDEYFDEVLTVNLKSAFAINRASIKLMLKQKYGRIINMTSVVAAMGNAGQANYAASKAGLTGMSKSLAQEVASKGITINCVAPGFITSPMTDVLNDEMKQKFFSKIPRGEFGTKEDVAAACLFLASDEAKYITGQTIHVNGGLIMV